MDNPDPLSGSVTVGHRTFFTHGYSREALLEIFVRPELERQLREAEEAYAAGHTEALSQAIELLREHCPSEPWPTWVQDGVAARVKGSVPQQVGRKGRHASAARRRKDDNIDIIRATLVDRLIHAEGITKTAACERVSETLRGDAVGTIKAMLDSHKRFHKRFGVEPHRYRGLLREWRALELLNATALGWERRHTKSST